MDNKDIYMELLDIGYQQDQTIKMVKDSASILQSLVEAASAPTVQQELPDIVIPDTVTISNLPEIQKVEVINEKTLELDKVESLLLQLLKAMPLPSVSTIPAPGTPWNESMAAYNVTGTMGWFANTVFKLVKGLYGK